MKAQTSQESEKLIKDIKDKVGINVEYLVKEEMVPIKFLKKWLIKRLYFDYAKTGRTYTDIKNELSAEYGISISSIEKLVYRGVYGK